MRYLRNIAINTALMCGTVVMCLLVGEFVVFRFVFPGSDVPANDFVNGVVRYAPHQSGIWRVRNEVSAPYAINAQGWNSGVGDYVVARKADVRRVAIVGDSFVEAFQVAHDKSVGENLSAALSGDASPVEAYRFAVSGAPLSQYVLMTEREVVRYRPDWIVVLLVHNDFAESFQFVPGRYTSSFLKLHLENGLVRGEIEPAPWRPGLGDWIRLTATARFLHYRWQVGPDILKSLFVGRAKAQTGRFAANVDLDAVLAQMPDIVAATDYLFARLSAVSRRNGARLLFAMDGDRNAIYGGNADAPTLALNAMAAAAARKHDVPFVDLHPAFAADWRANKQRFDFDTDGHWNMHGHSVAAGAIARAIMSRQ